MTDMTVGFLFVVMILLAFFDSQFRQDSLKNVPMVEEKFFVIEKNLRLKAQSDLNEMDEKLSRAQRQLIRFHDKNFQQETLIAKLSNENKVLNEELLKANKENQRLIELKNKLEQDIVSLRKELEKLQASLRNPLETYLKQVSDARRKLLDQLKKSISADFPDIPELTAELTEQSDALRFQGEGLFVSGQDIFIQRKQDIIKQLAIRLNEILPCYTFTTVSHTDIQCDNPNIAIVEAVQVEGHTDSVGEYSNNILLSAKRATTTFRLMMETVPGLRDFKNSKEQAVMSFAGYGPDRPVSTNDTAKGRLQNRRIDLRFIMVTPSSTLEMESIRTKFRDMQIR